MKRRLWLLGAVALFLVLSGCVLPEYFLGFEVVDVTYGGAVPAGYLRVEYNMTNTGSKDLAKATLLFEVEGTNDTVAPFLGTAYTIPRDMAVDESYSGYFDIYYTTTGNIMSAWAEVIEVGFEPADE